ncbi:MAG: hypothetical protein R3A45_02950 [Bdellovibrionota bacterium]
MLALVIRAQPPSQNASLTLHRQLNTPQTITVTGVNDADLVDETVTITLSVNDGASDDDFHPLADQTVTAFGHR